MNTNMISQNIKDSLKANVNRSAPASLAAKIMLHVRKEHALNVAPPNNTPVVFIGVLFALAAIAFPFLNAPELGATFSEIELPQVQIPTVAWLSTIVIGLLFAADKFMSTIQLKHIAK